MTINVTTGGATYRYLVDEQVIDWEVDVDTYSRLDGPTELDWRRQRASITLSQVWQHPPSWTGATSRPAALAQEIITNDGATLDLSVGGRTATIGVVLAPESINALTTAKGSSQLSHELRLVGDWLDPDDSGDKSTIDDINALKDAIGV
jgi:hypothetical protein